MKFHGLSAILLGLIGISLLSIMDALIKAATVGHPVLQVTFLRFVFGSLFAVVTVAVLRPGWPSAATIRINALRSVLVAITSSAFFFALTALPFAEAVALTFSAPIFIAVFAALILGERPGGRIVLALVVGFAGMLLMVGSRLGASGYSPGAVLGVMAAMLAAVTYALSMVLLRSRAQQDAIVIIVLLNSIGPMLLLALPAGIAWQPVGLSQALLLLLIGATGFFGHLFLANAFARETASRLAPLEYVALLWALGIGFWWFGEVPSLPMLAGAAMIVTGVLLTTRARPAIEPSPEQTVLRE